MTDPLVLAATLLDDPCTRAALLKAIEERVKADAEERRRFAAAAEALFRPRGQNDVSVSR